MNTEDELALLAAEEASLQFSSFNTDTAWEIGSELKAEAERRSIVLRFQQHVASVGRRPQTLDKIFIRIRLVKRDEFDPSSVGQFTVFLHQRGALVCRE